MMALLTGCAQDPVDAEDPTIVGPGLQPGLGGSAPTTGANGDPLTTGSTGRGATGGSPGTGVTGPATPALGLADVVGHWYLSRDGKERLTLTVARPDAAADLTGSSLIEGRASADAVDQIALNAVSAALGFRAHEATGDVWYALRVQDGVIAGRYARVPTGAARPDDALAYQGQVTGWRDETFSRDLAPRVWDIMIDDSQEAVLRIDRAAPDSSELVGRLKIFATDGGLDEHLTEDVEIESWDGTALSFVRRSSPAQERFTGTAAGRTIAGTFVATARATRQNASSWNGRRIEVLSHGLGAKSAATFTDWQARTRSRIGLLAMGGNPAPLTFKVTEVWNADPTADYYSGARDDNPAAFPQAYRLTELAFESTVPNPSGGAPLARQAHGYISVPTTAPPAGGYPVVLALNGHYGSAWDVFDPGWWFWYGDSFARRGYVVISVDIGHRPLEDRKSIYTSLPEGDDPGTGNGTHPAIKAAGSTSEWEEPGERAWDAMRALDYALSRSDVNRQQVALAGLSMGGEVSDWVAALDVRVGTTFAASSTSDLAVMERHDNHPCWKWQRGDAREYLDPADLTAMAAPRVMVRETGAGDWTYSDLATPFSAAKDVVRRAQPAFDALGGQLLHYLHFGGHAFHVGGFSPQINAAAGVTIPLQIAPAIESPWSNLWDSDGSTKSMASSIFDLLAGG
jgi:dienelactone hydrolase